MNDIEKAVMEVTQKIDSQPPPGRWETPYELEYIRENGERIFTISEAMEVFYGDDNDHTVIVIRSSHAIPIPGQRLPKEKDVAIELEGSYDLYDEEKLCAPPFQGELYVFPKNLLRNIPLTRRYAKYIVLGGKSDWPRWHASAIKAEELQYKVDCLEIQWQHAAGLGLSQRANEIQIEISGYKNKLERLESWLIC